MAEFADKTGSGIYFKQQLSQINGGINPLTRRFNCISAGGSSRLSRLLIVSEGCLPSLLILTTTLQAKREATDFYVSLSLVTSCSAALVPSDA